MSLVEIQFSLPLEPFSINRMYGRDKRHKTQAYKDWEISVLNCLNGPEPQSEFSKIRTMYEEGKHCFYVEFVFSYPEFFNKQGTVSSRTEDLSNVEKVLLDILFLPKFHVQQFPYGCQNMNVDDKYVIKLASEKKWGLKPRIDVKITMVPHPAPC